MTTYDELLKRLNAVPDKKTRDALFEMAKVVGGDDFANGLAFPANKVANATCATDANGNITALKGPDGVFIPATVKRNAAQMRPSVLDASAASSTSSHLERFIIPRRFSKIRLHVFNMDTAAVSGTYRILAAVSEKAPSTPAADIWKPIVGGVNQTALRADVGSPGWAKVTFSAAETVQIAIAASADSPSSATSDWIDLASIDRADGGLGNVLMLRYECLSGKRTTQAGMTSATAPKLPYVDAAGEDWYEAHTIYQKTGASAVTDLTLYGTDEEKTNCLAVAVELYYDDPALTILAHGDSLTTMSSGNVATWMFSSWIARAAKLASTGDRIYRSVIAARSGATYAEYSVSGYSLLTAISPDIFLHPVWSPNDTPPDATTMGIALANLNTAITNASAVGAKVIAWGPLPGNNYTAETDGYRKALIERVKAIAQSTQAFLYFDTEAFFSNGATPANMPEGLYYDQTHPNEAGTVLLAEKFAEYLQKLPKLS